MKFINFLKRIRHQRLRKFAPIWILFGKIYRTFAPKFNFKCEQYIGNYGPFRFDAEFLFTNYSDFGTGYNKGFEHLLKNLKSVDTFFDVGAHIGLISLPAALHMKKSGKIVAFEPSGKNFMHLKNHVKNNNLQNQIILNQNLIGEENCKKKFFISNKESAINSISKVHQIKDYKEVIISQITLDTYCRNTDLKPQIIKIDVEGAEINVLKGAKEIIYKYKPTIYLSIHPNHIKKLGTNINELTELINDLNYEIKDFSGNSISEYQLDEYLLTPK